jgi:catechol 2,3-dioxygenase-like lactoylglutathione lyase family enzyme
MEDSFAKPFLLNVNLPKKSVEEIEGIEVTRMGKVVYLDQVQESDDFRRPYYWISRSRPNSAEAVAGTDVAAIRGNRASITPLHIDLSWKGDLPEVQAVAADLLGRWKGLSGRSDPWAGEREAASPWAARRSRPVRPLRSAMTRLVCDDLEATIAFYQGLGFAVDQEYKDKEGRRWEVLLRKGGVAFRYAQREQYAGATARNFRRQAHGVGVDVYITTLNVQQVLDEFKQAGVAVDQELTTNYTGGKEFAIRDPNGYRLVFAQPGTPR